MSQQTSPSLDLDPELKKSLDEAAKQAKDLLRMADEIRKSIEDAIKEMEKRLEQTMSRQ